MAENCIAYIQSEYMCNYRSVYSKFWLMYAQKYPLGE